MTDFNDMLKDFATTDPRLHYIDLRSLISDSDWANELHLKNSGYRRVAEEFDRVIRPLLFVPNLGETQNSEKFAR